MPLTTTERNILEQITRVANQIASTCSPPGNPVASPSGHGAVYPPEILYLDAPTPLTDRLLTAGVPTELALPISNLYLRIANDFKVKVEDILLRTYQGLTAHGSTIHSKLYDVHRQKYWNQLTEWAEMLIRMTTLRLAAPRVDTTSVVNQANNYDSTTANGLFYMNAMTNLMNNSAKLTEPIDENIPNTNHDKVYSDRLRELHPYVVGSAAAFEALIEYFDSRNNYAKTHPAQELLALAMSHASKVTPQSGNNNQAKQMVINAAATTMMVFLVQAKAGPARYDYLGELLDHARHYL